MNKTKEIVELARQGMGTEEIADRTGMAKVSVCNILGVARRLGVLGQQDRWCGSLPEDEVARMAANGFTSRAIAAAAGVPESAVVSKLRTLVRNGVLIKRSRYKLGGEE